MISHDIKESFHLGGRVIVLDRVRNDPHEPDAYGARITYDLPVGRGRRPRRRAPLGSARQAPTCARVHPETGWSTPVMTVHSETYPARVIGRW